MRFVWGCTFPLVVLINLYRFLFSNVDTVQKKHSAFGWVLVWPAFVLVRPRSRAAHGRSYNRRQEYEADAGAIAAGYGPGLASALAKQKDFEIARSGWEEALLKTHPPIEFRLEAIEEAWRRRSPRGGLPPPRERERPPMAGPGNRLDPPDPPQADRDNDHLGSLLK